VRPGTLDAPVKISDREILTAAEFFVQCQQKKRNPKFIHPDLIPILKDTHGINLFQEQTLRIFRDLGGMSYEQAEMARRAIGKKDKELLAQEIGKLKQALIEKGNWTDSQIEELADVIIASSSYSFNASHSAAYAVVAYNAMWLKYHYPIHFYRGLLSINNDDHDEIKFIIREAGDIILPPDVQCSHASEWLIEGNKLRAPLCLIKGVGTIGAVDLKNFIDNGLKDLIIKEVKEKPPAKPRKKKGEENNAVEGIFK
jgi:DNA polymerase-3 subunit alpha